MVKEQHPLSFSNIDLRVFVGERFGLYRRLHVWPTSELRADHKHQ
jgi:hypothetical protein